MALDVLLAPAVSRFLALVFEGSHRLPEYYFSGEHRSWDPGRDGTEQHEEWARLLHEHSHRLGFPLRTFRPKKGDTLIWSADLVLGGSTVIERSATRQSQVGHYCPVGVSPNYFSYRPDRQSMVRCLEAGSPQSSTT